MRVTVKLSEEHAVVTLDALERFKGDVSTERRVVASGAFQVIWGAYCAERLLALAPVLAADAPPIVVNQGLSAAEVDMLQDALAHREGELRSTVAFLKRNGLADVAEDTIHTLTEFSALRQRLLRGDVTRSG